MMNTVFMSMKKICLTLTAILCFAATMTAGTVSPDAAKQVAALFFRAQGTTITDGSGNPQCSRSITKSPQYDGQIDANGDAPAYYIFNADTAHGFVVVSGDDCVGENLVLGYALKGSFDPDNVPENMKWWLDSTAKAIARLSSLGIRPAHIAIHDDIAPMITSQWDQGFQYNLHCPMLEGKHCITGCMATALAQVMRYHRWPQGPTAYAIPAYTMANGTVVEGLPVTQFDWDNMLDSYSGTSTAAQQDAVAELMRYCGQSLQMEYTPQGSNGRCYFLDVLVNCFGYDPSLYSAHADEYSVRKWDALIYNELHNGRPLVYSGYSTGGGHAFVIDGYQTQSGDGYYHVNWGWSGNSDGYYKISLLNADGSGSGASSTPDGYNVRQEALINMTPRTNLSEPFYRRLSSFEWNLMTKNGPRFGMVNQSWEAGSFTFALVGRNSDGSPDYSRVYAAQQMDVSAFNSASYFQGNTKGVLYITLSDNLGHAVFDGCAPGRHDVMFVCQENVKDAPIYPVYGPNAYFKVNIDDDSKFKNFVVHPHAELTSSADIRVEGLMQRGVLNTATATISNSGGSYIGTVACYLCTLSDDVLTTPYVKSRTGIMVERGTASEVSFPLSAPQAGEYVLVVMSVENYLPLNTPLADIAQLPCYLCHKVVTFDELTFVCDGVNYVENTGEQPLYQLKIALDNGTSMDYNAFLMVNLYRKDTSGEWEAVTMPDMPMIYCPLKLDTGQQTTASMKLSEALTSGDYRADLFIANDFHSNQSSDYFVFDTIPFSVGSTGIKRVESDGLSNIWHDLCGRRLNKKPTERGVYISNGQKILVK